MILPRFGRRSGRRAAAAAAVAGILGVLACACASAPTPSAAERKLAKNARATIEGRVVGEDGSPVAGISVYALPRGKDISWSPPAVTDSAGRFRLTVFAPAEYGFLLRSEKRTVVTPLPEDPSRLEISVAPGELRQGIEIVFLRKAWEDVR